MTQPKMSVVIRIGVRDAKWDMSLPRLKALQAAIDEGIIMLKGQERYLADAGYKILEAVLAQAEAVVTEQVAENASQRIQSPVSRNQKQLADFRIGDRVTATDLAFANELFTRGDAPVLGTVIGFCKSPAEVRVRRDRQKADEKYHVDFWKSVESPR